MFLFLWFCGSITLPAGRTGALSCVWLRSAGELCQPDIEGARVIGVGRQEAITRAQTLHARLIGPLREEFGCTGSNA